MLRNVPPEQDDQEKPKKPPVREPADWVEAVGPESMEPEEVIENVHEEGFEKLDEDDFVSDPTYSPADMPTWTEDDFVQIPKDPDDNLIERPTETDVTEEIDSEKK